MSSSFHSNLKTKWNKEVIATKELVKYSTEFFDGEMNKPSEEWKKLLRKWCLLSLRSCSEDNFICKVKVFVIIFYADILATAPGLEKRNWSGGKVPIATIIIAKIGGLDEIYWVKIIQVDALWERRIKYS